MRSAGRSIGVGIVGAGWMGQVHAASWVANAPRGEIVAVADVSEARARALANEYTSDDARVYADLDSLLADPTVDAVDICLPHHLHADAIARAARGGKHIFCEKPICLSFDEARAIKLAVDSANVILVCRPQQPFPAAADRGAAPCRCRCARSSAEKHHAPTGQRSDGRREATALARRRGPVVLIDIEGA